MNPVCLLLVIPVVFAVCHYRWGKFPLSASVTLSCAAITFLRADPWITAAFLVSVVGDWFMNHSGGKDGDRMLLCGIGGFFFAHVCFLLAGIRKIRAEEFDPFWLIPCAFFAAGYTVFLVKKLFPALDGRIMKAAVSAYVGISLSVITVSLLSSAAPLPKFLFAAGIAMILFSDTLIALSRFLKIKKVGRAVCPTYFACHILVAASVFAERGFF